MTVAPPSRVTPLRRCGPGRMETRDGLWEIVLDPGEHPELGIGGARTPRRVWYVYPKAPHHPGVDTSLPAFIDGERAWASLGNVVFALCGAKTVEVEPLE